MKTLEQGKAIASAIGKAISSLYVKKEIAQIDSQIAKLQNKKSNLTSEKTYINIAKNSVKIDEIKGNLDAKSKAIATCEKSDLIIDVAANTQVKDICRNIERKLQRNLSSKSEEDKQLLYNHLLNIWKNQMMKLLIRLF